MTVGLPGRRDGLCHSGGVSTGRQYAGRSSQDRRDERRQRLMAAGLALIGREGAAALSVRGVCAEAGITPRYFYEEFGSTDELARQLFDREFDACTARVGAAVATGRGDAADAPESVVRVSAAVGALLDFVTELPDRAALLLTEASGAGALAQRRQERMEDVVAIVAAFGRSTYATGEGPSTPAGEAEAERSARSAAAFVAGGLAHSIDEWLRGRLEGSREVLEQELAAQIVAVGDTTFALLGAALARLEPPGGDVSS